MNRGGKEHHSGRARLLRLTIPRLRCPPAVAGWGLRHRNLRSKFDVLFERWAGAIMTPRNFALALSGTVALAGLGVAGVGIFNLNPPYVETTAPSVAERAPASPEPAVVTAAAPVSEAAPGDANPPEPIIPAGAPAAEAPAVEPVLTDSGAKPPPETGMQLASAPPSDPVNESPNPLTRSIEPPQECVTDTCIDAYLWSLYERTPKIDTNKVPEQIKVTIKKHGKTRTVTQTVMTYVVDDFAWKDPAAAQRGGRSLMDYVIGGMDRGFRRTLYRALRAMDDAGLMPGITSGFRDDYRQSIATGNKAAPDSSYHGGSRRGGYGHGLAADLVSVKGDTRMQRFAASEEMWKWIDAHEKELGIGRPYLDHDPPHVGPLDGTEYIVKRSLANARRRALQAKMAERAGSKAAEHLAAHTDAAAPRRATPGKLSKLSKGAT